jgi:parallel beta-helix repeat protein
MPRKLNAVAARSMLGLFSTVLAGAVGMVLLFGGDRALAGDLDCGDTITADATLGSDLVDCPNNGIVIGADDITLDLNGHRIDGDGTEFAGCGKGEFCDVGVVNDGHDGVTVRDGSVREFAFGVFLGRARHNRVIAISSSRHIFFGLFVAESARSVIRASSLRRNIAPEGDGMGLFGSRHVRIVNNKIRRNPGPGIHVEDSADNLIKGNVFSRNGPGLLIEGDRNQVRRNRFIRDGGVLVGSGGHNVIARNRVVRSFESIAVEDGRGNLVARNVVTRPRGGAGIRLGIGQPPIGGANNVVRRNLVRGGREDGFLVAKKDNDSVLKRNVAIGAKDDGFRVRNASTKLTRNRAVRNGDLGIQAVFGVTDGGGNTAHGNGDPRECTNIACS